MIRDRALVFDERLRAASPMGTTADKFCERLSIHDAVALFAIVDHTSGSGDGTLTVVAQHSPDGVNWADLVTPISAGTVMLNQTSALAGGFLTGFPFTRLVISLQASITAADVKLYAVMRDTSD